MFFLFCFVKFVYFCIVKLKLMKITVKVQT